MEKMITSIIKAEWAMFQCVNNVGGRAECQDNDQQFYGMRYAQFSAWSEEALTCYLKDVAAALEIGRNLVAEKYLRMMEFTSPYEYAMQEDAIPRLSEEHKALADEICDIMVEQTVPLRTAYPLLCCAGRPLYSSQDESCGTSIQTYQRGELYTYSIETLRALKKHIVQLQQEGRSLAREILSNTTRYYGYKSLEEAEKALFRNMGRQ